MQAPTDRRRRGRPDHIASRRTGMSGSVRSRLVESEIKAWANGTISSAKLWQFVSDMHEDGFHHPAAERIRSCGHSSTDQNIANNFIKLLESCGLGALRDEIDGGTVTCIILPSKLLGWMFKQNRQKYYKAMCGGNVRKVAEFWARLRNQPLGNMLFDLHPHLRGRSLESLTLSWRST